MVNEAQVIEWESFSCNATNIIISVIILLTEISMSGYFTNNS